MRRRNLASVMALTCALALLGACKGSRAPGPVPEALADPATTDGSGGARVPLDDEPAAPAAPADAGVEKAAALGAPAEAPAVEPPANVRISIRSSPRASVVWGRKTLGTTPLSVERPRESGPMDLVLYAKGFLTVHTRAYTFRNDSLSVDMTPVAKSGTLLGAKKAPPATPDGGVPPP